MLQLALYLKRGDTFDPECYKTTHRLRVARGLLREHNIVPTVEHCAQCVSHPSNRGPGLNYDGCWDACHTIWPSWVTDPVFEQAAAAANAIQNLKGLIGSLQINVVKEESK